MITTWSTQLENTASDSLDPLPVCAPFDNYTY